MSSAFTEEQTTKLKSIFKKNAFSGYRHGKFHFKSGPKPSTLANFLKVLGSPTCFESVPCLVPLALALLKKEVPTKDLMEVIEEWTEENKREMPSLELEVEDSEDDEELNGFLRTLVPTVNISENVKPHNKIILLDPAQGHRPVSGIDNESYLTMQGLTWRDLLIDPTIHKVFTCFDPYELRYIFKRPSKDGSFKSIMHVNFYVPPRWRFLKVAAAYEGFIKGLIDHLFPNPEEREYVLDWLHYALVKRNETVLCLIGPRGTGKGVLLNNIMPSLIGADYHGVAKQEVLTEKFNAEFNNKRFLFFDEVDVSGEKELNKFKQLANARISMESKGEDATTIDNFVSMALSSNNKREFRAEPQERRLSVPEITENPLFDIYTEEEVGSFCERVAEPESEEIAAFGNWLIKRVPNNALHKPLKGKYYFDLCKLSMAEWKIFIIDHIVEEGIVDQPTTIKDLEKLFKRFKGSDDKTKIFWPNASTIQIFLGDYSHEAVCRIGSIVASTDRNGRDTRAILPNAEFLRKFGKKYKKEVETDDEGLDGL